jgi:hypothetical protein
VAGYCEEANRKECQDIARRRPTERCGRILREGGQLKIVAGYCDEEANRKVCRILRGRGLQKGVAGYCEEEANRKLWQDIARRRPTKVVSGYSVLFSHVHPLKIINLNYADYLIWSQKK